jgi:hypothetical protein
MKNDFDSDLDFDIQTSKHRDQNRIFIQSEKGIVWNWIVHCQRIHRHPGLSLEREPTSRLWPNARGYAEQCSQSPMGA